MSLDVRGSSSIIPSVSNADAGTNTKGVKFGDGGETLRVQFGSTSASRVAAYPIGENGKTSLMTSLRLALGFAVKLKLGDGKVVALNVNSLAKRLGIAKSDIKEATKTGNLSAVIAKTVGTAEAEREMKECLLPGIPIEARTAQEKDCHVLSKKEVADHLKETPQQTLPEEKTSVCSSRSPKHPKKGLDGNRSLLQLMEAPLTTDTQVTAEFFIQGTQKTLTMGIESSLSSDGKRGIAQANGASGYIRQEKQAFLQNAIGDRLPTTLTTAELNKLSCQDHADLEKRLRLVPQEDKTLSTTVQLTLKDGRTVDAALTGLFDGHGGSGASKYISDNFQKTFEKHLKQYAAFSENDDQCIVNAFRHTCMEINRNCPGDKQGTTANIQLSFPDGDSTTVYTANVGDSPSFVITNDGIIATSAQDEATKEKKVLIKQRSGLKELESVSAGNSIGDHDFNGGINFAPEVTKMSFPPDSVCIQCSDGVVPDVLSMNDVAAIVKKCRDAEVTDPSKIAAEIIKVIASLGGDDNSTVIVTIN